MMMAMKIIMATVYSPPSTESRAGGQQAFPPPDILLRFKKGGNSAAKLVAKILVRPSKQSCLGKDPNSYSEL